MAPPKVKQSAKEWQELVDMRGPFVPLKELEKALASAPAETQETQIFGFLEGLYLGRLIHEELGGIEDAR